MPMFELLTCVWVLEEFPDTIDSVWTDEDAMLRRKAELDAENGGEYACVHKFHLNMPNGYAP